MKQAAAVVQDFIRSSSYPVYDMAQHTGFWRSLLVRYSERNNQLLMVVIVGNPHNRSLSNANEALQLVTDEIRQEIDTVMRELMQCCVSKIPHLASFSYQLYFLFISQSLLDLPVYPTLDLTALSKPCMESLTSKNACSISPSVFRLMPSSKSILPWRKSSTKILEIGYLYTKIHFCWMCAVELVQSDFVWQIV